MKDITSKLTKFFMGTLLLISASGAATPINDTLRHSNNKTSPHTAQRPYYENLLKCLRDSGKKKVSERKVGDSYIEKTAKIDSLQGDEYLILNLTRNEAEVGPRGLRFYRSATRFTSIKKVKGNNKIGGNGIFFYNCEHGHSDTARIDSYNIRTQLGINSAEERIMEDVYEGSCND